MQNKQAERFDRLRELAEQFTSSHPDQGDDFQDRKSTRLNSSHYS